MEGGPELGAAVVFAVGLVLWGATAARLKRLDVTAPLAFTALGALVVNDPLDVVTVRIDLGSPAVRTIAEFALALVLFSDAARVNAQRLRHDPGIPGRLLGLALPLSIGAGVGLALLCFTDVDWWLAAVIGAALAPTDAALGLTVIEDARVPGRIRRALNVESGLNDGLVAPVVTFFVVGAVRAADPVVRESVGQALLEIATGVLVGAAAGALGGWFLAREWAVGWASERFVPLAVLGLAALAFAGAEELGSNGFVAAFVGGLGFGVFRRRDGGRSEEDPLALVTRGGEVLSLLVWFLFGALVVDLVGDAPTITILYVALSLTVVRMVPVTVAMIGTGLHATTVAFLGWFGPRGLASVVFALLAFDALPRDDGRLVVGVIGATVLASIVLHGLTAGLLAGRYGRRADALADGRPERRRVDPLPTRRIG